MEDNKTMSENFKNELEAISANNIFIPAYKKKKLILWFIRNTISVILYIIFGEYKWVQWSLWVTIPLSLFSLITITAMPYFLKIKTEKTNKKINDFETLLGEKPTDN